jgi:hypothetical protein
MIEYTHEEAVMLRETAGPQINQTTRFAIKDENNDPQLSPEQIILRTIRLFHFGNIDHWILLYNVTFIKSLKEMPLYINDETIIGVVAKWRLKIAR